MDIYFADKKLAKILNSRKEAERKYGHRMAKVIMQRLTDVEAAENLEVLMTLPGRHHPLKGGRKGQFACDLVHPYRLIYEPGNNPLPQDESGGLIYSEITVIDIIEITDYH